MHKTVWRAILGGMLALAALIVTVQLWQSRADAMPARDDPLALRVASLNVHYILLDRATGPWSLADWHRRKPALIRTVAALDADIIAFQEMESFRRGDDGSVNLARDALLQALPEFAAGASGDWRRFPSTQPIFYRRDRLRLLDQGWFFFSQTPDVIYSRTFDGTYPAYASWAQFRDLRSGTDLRVVNLHTDWRNGQNRMHSMALTARRIAPWLAEGQHVVVAGDFNARAGAASLRILEQAGLSLTPARGASMHFGRGLALFGAIDHIMHDCGTALTGQPVVVPLRPDGVWPSDHHPVLAQLRPGAGTCVTATSSP